MRLSTSNTDWQLIEQINAGNKQAISLLYERHELYWFRMCLRYGRNREEAQDMFQEGVAKLFSVLNKFDKEKGSFKAWSNKVLLNEGIKFLKKQVWQHSFENLEKANEQFSLEDAIGELSAKELIEVIQQLPVGYRTVFNMHELEGYKHHEIAKALDISPGTSKSQLFKAKKMLHQKMKLLFK